MHTSAMQDEHGSVLSLDEGQEPSNAFFAVYDGHIGACHSFRLCVSLPYIIQGNAIAKFASNNVHKRLLTEEAYREKRYEEALKRAFLGTDEDFLAGKFQPPGYRSYP
jgi:protein phosphatase 2C family protein 2/3